MSKDPLGGRGKALFAGMLATALLFGQETAWPQAQAAEPEELVVYGDAMGEGFMEYGWAQKNLASTAYVKSGSHAIEMNPDEGQALYFYKDRILSNAEYGKLIFWINGGSAGGQQLKLSLSLSGQTLLEKNVSDLVSGGAIPAGQWVQATVDLAELGPSGIMDGILLWGQGDQEPVYVDEISFSGSGAGGGGEEPSGEEPTEEPTEEPQHGEPVSLAFEHQQISVREGGLAPAVLLAQFEDGTTAEFEGETEWTSSDPEVAEASGGTVRGLKPGAATIIATHESLAASLAVEVTERGETIPTEPVDGIYVYDDAVNEPFRDLGSVEHVLDEHDVVRSGESSIRMKPAGEEALYFYAGYPILTKEYEKLRLWVNGGAAGGQQLKLAFLAGGAPVKELSGDELFPDGVPAGQWTQLEFRLPDLELPNGLFDGLIIAGTGGVQEEVYLDDIALVRKYVAPPKMIELRTDKPELVLLPGEEYRVEAETLYETGATEIVSAKAVWQSGNPDIATVNGGAVEGVSPGIARITAEYNGQTAVIYVQVTETADEIVYADELAVGYRNQSWHDKDLANTEQVHGGTRSIKFEPDGWDGVWLAGDAKKPVVGYYGVEFWIYATGAGNQKLNLHAYDGTMNVGSADLAELLEGGVLPANQWTRVRANLADLGMTDGQFDGVIFQAGTEDNQAPVYIDDVKLLRNLHPGRLPEPERQTLEVTVDKEADRRPINPEIYGINFDDMHPTNSTLKYPVQRWGGNNTTRYNWKIDAANRSADWYFMNFPYEEHPDGTMSDRFMDAVRAQGGNVLLTVPTIGWTPKSRDVTWGFSQQKYGRQQESAQGYPDAGNGVLGNGQNVAGNDPSDTSVPIGPEFVTEWMRHIAERTNNTHHYYALDNEPEIWHVTHRDVHPEAPTYDEIWGFTERYGTAIKNQDSQAKIFGPTSWGWCAYFYSSADNCADGPDRQAHDGKPFLEWYLEQAKNYEDTYDRRLIDYLDIHFYPQEGGVADFDEGAEVVKRRFQALKSLYDPNFVDNSWIQEPIRLIPRMKEMIDAKYPGTKFAITEYNFGNGLGISAGLAQAEALSIFGREGVDLAIRFGNFQADTPIEDAFKLFLDYDGQGSRILGDSVRATSAIPDVVGSYSIVAPDGKTFVLLFNKDTALRNVQVNGSFGEGKTGELYRFTATKRLGADGTVGVTDAGFSLKLPAKSAALVVIE